MHFEQGKNIRQDKIQSWSKNIHRYITEAPLNANEISKKLGKRKKWKELNKEVQKRTKRA